MNKPKFKVGDRVECHGLEQEVIFGPILFGNFYIYDIADIEYSIVNYGVHEDEIKKIETKKENKRFST